MQELIGGWRRVWQQGQFPVYFVQLAPYRHRDDPTKLPIIWEAQTQELDDSQHGHGGHDGRRRGQFASARQAGRGGIVWHYGPWPKPMAASRLVYSGPLFTFYEINGRKMVLHFDHVGGGLVSPTASRWTGSR